jgi:hypothetical protein
MDFHLPLSPDDSLVPRRRGPVPVWMLVALVGVILGVAMVAAGVVTDTRDFAHRHASVLPSRAL